ncbi:MAG: hypothetical protein KC613_23780 [Myxococcales bacterium]|nr:hypothetical protein [Myxococcales bacterium]MCB9523737.1 hypothetical protein [Myxococcales bacterium]
MRALTLAGLLLTAGSAHAFQCKPVHEVWVPAQAVAPLAFVVVESNVGLDPLLASPPHFVDAEAAPVPAQVERLGHQAVLRPTRPLKGTARLVLPQGWPAPAPWPVAPAANPPQWAADPKLIDQDDRDMGRYGPSWSRIVQVEAPGATLVQITVPQPLGPAAVRYLAVLDGTVNLGTHPCAVGLGSVLKPGPNAVTLRPVGAGGALGEPRPLAIPGPRAPQP